MSRQNQPKNKRLDNLEVATSDKVWDKVGVDKNNKPIYKLKKDIILYGKVRKGTTSYISTNNRNGENHRYVDDFNSLNIKTKKEICDLIENKKKKVVYLIDKGAKKWVIRN